MRPLPFPFPNQNCQTLWKIIPIKDKHKMIIQWVLPYHKEDYKSKPHYYLCMLLNYEGDS